MRCLAEDLEACQSWDRVHLHPAEIEAVLPEEQPRLRLHMGESDPSTEGVRRRLQVDRRQVLQLQILKLLQRTGSRRILHHRPALMEILALLRALLHHPRQHAHLAQQAGVRR